MASWKTTLHIVCIVALACVLAVLFRQGVGKLPALDTYASNGGIENVVYENVLRFALRDPGSMRFVAATKTADILVMFGTSPELGTKIVCEDEVCANFVKNGILNAINENGVSGARVEITVGPITVQRGVTNAVILTPNDARIKAIKELDVLPFDYAKHMSFQKLGYIYPWLETRMLDVRHAFKHTQNAGLYRLFSFAYLYALPADVPIGADVFRIRQRVVAQYGIELQNFMEIYFGRWDIHQSVDDMVINEGFTPDGPLVKVLWDHPVDVQTLHMETSWYKEAVISELPIPLKRGDTLVLTDKTIEHMDGEWTVVNCDGNSPVCTIATALPIDATAMEFIERKSPYVMVAKPIGDWDKLFPQRVYIKSMDLLGERNTDKDGGITYIMKHMASLEQIDYDNNGVCISDPEIPSKHRCAVWDKPCSHDTQCPFYRKSDGRGGCTNGYCEMPMDVQRIGYRKYSKTRSLNGHDLGVFTGVFPMDDAYKLGLVDIPADIEPASNMRKM